MRKQSVSGMLGLPKFIIRLCLARLNPQVWNRSLSTAFRTFQSEIRVARMHANGVQKSKELQTDTPLKLHLGCGPKLKKGWINVASRYRSGMGRVKLFIANSFLN